MSLATYLNQLSYVLILSLQSSNSIQLILVITTSTHMNKGFQINNGILKYIYVIIKHPIITRDTECISRGINSFACLIEGLIE
jgi:hypothetical protein